jgi:hypothetical protein
MQLHRGDRRRFIVERTLEVILLAVCSAASAYGLSLLSGMPYGMPTAVYTTPGLQFDYAASSIGGPQAIFPIRHWHSLSAGRHRA